MLNSLTFRALALRQRENVFVSDEGPMLETLNFTIRIGSTPTFLYFGLYISTLPTQHTTFIINMAFKFAQQCSSLDNWICI